MNQCWLGARGSFKDIDEKTPFAAPENLTSLFEAIRTCKETPAPGFYDRVRNQIDQFGRQSIWIPLIYSSFRMRFVTACLSASFVLLAYLLTAEWDFNHAVYLIDGKESKAIFSPAGVQQMRDSVLIQIATHDRAE